MTYWLSLRFWPFGPWQAETETRDSSGRLPGSCERCGAYGMICLNGQRFLCWDHYCEEMRRVVR